jgi:DNA-directed RNA polymerase specialized sigma24 family protein
VETDGALIERSVRGRPDTFVEVVRRHEVAVHGFLARRAGRQPADDLLGEVWVRAFAARGALLATPAVLAHRDLPSRSRLMRRTAGREH